MNVATIHSANQLYRVAEIRDLRSEIEEARAATTRRSVEMDKMDKSIAFIVYCAIMSIWSK
jgi:hypothetical protein